MVQFISKYTGSSELAANSSNHPHKANQNDSNYALALENANMYSLTLSQQDLTREKTEASRSWMKQSANLSYNPLISRTLEVKGSRINAFDIDVPKVLVVEDLDHAEQVLFSIARAIESRDPNTGNHCERLVKLGEAFGKYLNFSHTQIRDLMWGGYLHDVGKVGIPDAVLLKGGKLTPQEWDIMRQHVLIGEKICLPLRSMRSVIPIIRHHHERWDGSGYPDGLIGDEIPYIVQVFQIIDIYDALTSERPYKKPFTTEEALSVMAKETESGWRNPKLLKQFVEFITS